MSKIEINNITKTFGDVTALRNVNVNFEENHIYGLLGRNGAGKTTLLNLITGKMFPNSGEILVDGERAIENDRALSKMYCMTEFNLYPERMRVKEAFHWSAGFYPQFDMEYANTLCSQFELKTNHKIKNLSTGYTSIFKIIIALSCGAEIVIFDEPVLGLDANHREMFYKELIQNYSNYPRTFILSTHLIEEVATIIDRVVIIKSGEVIMDDEVQNVLNQGCTVSGPAGAVDDFIKGKQLLGSDTIGGLKSAYLLGQFHDIPSNLEMGKLDLQKLFIQLTNA
ncbi:MAG: transporter related [Caproiciproducens sp.]|nr:transporter related [Caproiciproducens sp.]